MLKFRGIPFFGTHDIVVAPPAELHTTRTFFWGLKGESEIVGGTGGRMLSCYIWLHNKYQTRLALEQGIITINSWIGENGTLEEEDIRNNTRLTYNDVTFEGFTKTNIGGRDSEGALFDYAGTVDGGWFQPGTLSFRQLISQ